MDLSTLPDKSLPFAKELLQRAKDIHYTADNSFITGYKYCIINNNLKYVCITGWQHTFYHPDPDKTIMYIKEEFGCVTIFSGHKLKCLHNNERFYYLPKRKQTFYKNRIMSYNNINTLNKLSRYLFWKNFNSLSQSQMKDFHNWYVMHYE